MRVTVLGYLSVLGLALLGPAAAQPVSAPQKQNRCFFSSQFENWRASDAKTIYIRVNLNRYYRLDLSNACPTLLWPDAHLITKIRGSNSVCSAIDWDLEVSQGYPSLPSACIVKTMTELSPEEAAALPKKIKP
jgi:Family of unknown function (DUF6491)